MKIIQRIVGPLRLFLSTYKFLLIETKFENSITYFETYLKTEKSYAINHSRVQIKKKFNSNFCATVHVLITQMSFNINGKATENLKISNWTDIFFDTPVDEMIQNLRIMHNYDLSDAENLTFLHFWYVSSF